MIKGFIMNIQVKRITNLILICLPIMLLNLSGCNTNKESIDLVRYVDPFIGSGGHGHVFVGANVPFGAVQILGSVKQLDGVSLKNTLKGSNTPVHNYLFFETGLARGVMTKDWKYITVRYDAKSEKQVSKGVIFEG